MSRKTKNPKETLNRYSTLVRQAMSDKYVECAKLKNELTERILDIHERLVNEKCTLPYQDYVDLQEEYERLERGYHDQRVMLYVWDQAREICIERADEVFGGDFERFIYIWNNIPEGVRVSEKELERLLTEHGEDRLSETKQ